VEDGRVSGLGPRNPVRVVARCKMQDARWEDPAAAAAAAAAGARVAHFD